MLDVRLTTFITIANIKSFTKAAEILNLTQPAVSQHIKYLEEYYKANLIRKNGKNIDLTEEGQILYKYARELEMIHRDLENELRNKNSIRKIYNVGATMTIGGYVLPYILAEYKKSYKNIDLLLQVNNTEEIIDKLLKRKLDLALVEGNFDRNKFNYIKFKDDEMVLAVSPKHPFAKKNEVTIEEVLEGEIILREKGSGTREVFEDKLRNLGCDMSKFTPYMEIGSISAIKSLVEENLGYSIISMETIKREVRLGSIKVLPVKGVELHREFNFIYLKDSSLDTLESFIRFCFMKT